MVKLYRCLCCSGTGNFQLKKHLHQNPRCFKYYQGKFEVQSYEEIKSKLFNLSRQSHLSRSKVSRKLENAIHRDKKKNAITVTECLNKFRQQTALSNYRLCISCLQFFMMSGAIELKPDDETFKKFDLQNKQELKRQNKFWMCLFCLGSQKPSSENYSLPKMKSITIEGRKVLYPSNGVQNDEIEIDMNTLVLSPRNSSALGYKPDNFALKMYVIQNPTNKTFTTHYNSRLSKFYHRRINAETYDGVINEEDPRMLLSLNPIYDDSVIRNSDSWKKKKRSTLYSCFSQFGQMSIGFNFNIELKNIETIATSLLCTGRVITIEYIGNEEDEYERNYFLHSHSNTEECSSTCVRTELVNIDVPLPAKYIPNYLSSVVQKQSAFVENFLKCNNFPLASDDYYCGINFRLNGMARNQY